MFRIVFILFRILVYFLMQTSLFSYFTVSMVVPDCLLVLVVLIAYTRGQNKAIIVGALSGLLLDLMSGEIIGICPIIYMFVAFLAGFTNKIYDRNDHIIPHALIFSGELFYQILYYSVTFLLSGKTEFVSYMGNTIIPRVDYTMVFGFLIYPLFLLNEKILRHFEGSEDA